MTFNLEIFLLKEKMKKILNFQGVRYSFIGGIVKKKGLGYVGTILVAEINIYMYKKLLVFHHLILSKDYVAHFAAQLL